jgi:hypothetical protein
MKAPCWGKKAGQMVLNDWKDAKETAAHLIGMGVARGLLEAKIDGLEEAISQISQAKKRDETLVSIEKTLRQRRDQLHAEIPN